MSSSPQRKAELRKASSIYPDRLPESYSFLTSSPVTKRINFRHPAYPPEDDLLFTLYAWDHADGGLHHGFAHSACVIFAANRQDGYLSESRSGTRIAADWDDILLAGNYYFHVPFLEYDSSEKGPYRWPVVPSFQDWPFPSTIPEAWARPDYTNTSFYTAPQSSLSAAVRARDANCRISGHFTGTEVAHLCPEHEREWFLRNSMAMWNTDLTLDPDNLVNDLSNVVLLRSDLHTAFNERKFVFYPKSDDGFVLHMLEPTPDIGQLYHNVRVHPLLQCNPRFLYARLAWALFPSLSAFLSKPSCSRYLMILKSTPSGAEWVKEEISSPGRLRMKVSASRSRTPGKRQRAAEVERGEEIEQIGPSSSKKICMEALPSVQNILDMGCSDPGLKRFTLPPTSGEQHLEKVLFEEELAQDMEMQRKILPNFEEYDEAHHPPAWYPGWRRVQRLKNEWISRGRPADFTLSRAGQDNLGWPEGNRFWNAKQALESMGVEIIEDFSSDDE